MSNRGLTPSRPSPQGPASQRAASLRQRTARSAWLLLAAGGVLVALIAAFPPLAPGLVGVLGVLGVGGLALGAARGGRRSLWWWSVAAGVVSILGANLRVVYAPDVGSVHVVPDSLTIASYLLFGLMLVKMLKARRGAASGPEVADAVLVTAGAWMVAWAFVVAPNAGEDLTAALVVNILYPCISLALLFVAGLLAMTRLEGVKSFWFLFAGFALVLAGDVVYAAAAAGFGLDVAPASLLYSLAFVLVGFAALHPSAARIVEPACSVARPLRGGRLVAVTTALALPLGVLLLSPPETFVGVVGAGLTSGVMVLVVVWRMRHAVESYASSEALLSVQASTDALTGLPNRRGLESLIGEAVTEGTGTAVLFCDLDAFKTVNDTWGHTVGDVLLQGVAERITSVLAPGEELARPSGDEFVVVCSGVGGSKEALGAAARVVEAMRTPVVLGGSTVLAPLSIGVSWRGPGVPATADDLLREADTAMYVAKDAAKRDADAPRFVLFDETMREAVAERLSLEVQLRHALATGEGLSLVYQPIFDSVTLQVTGFEALSRWTHAERGLVSPGRFIPVAEESGLITELGRWSLRTALEQLSAWQRVYGKHLTMSVNLSARQLYDTGLVEYVQGLLSVTGVEPSSLFLEITETMLFDVEAAKHLLDELKGVGVRLSADDFGTGYSSLSYLRQFPVDQVKVDRSFVDGLGRSLEDEAIVRAIVSMGHALGLHVVAEGVETRVQQRVLSEMGCEKLQGFLLGRPVPAPDAERALSLPLPVE